MCCCGRSIGNSLRGGMWRWRRRGQEKTGLLPCKVKYFLCEHKIKRVTRFSNWVWKCNQAKTLQQLNQLINTVNQHGAGLTDYTALLSYTGVWIFSFPQLSGPQAEVFVGRLSEDGKRQEQTELSAASSTELEGWSLDRDIFGSFFPLIYICDSGCIVVFGSKKIIMYHKLEKALIYLFQLFRI